MYKINGKVANGRFSNQAEYRRVLGKLEGKQISINIDERKIKRSIPSNNYLWGVVYKYISDDTGYTEEELHYEVFALMFRRYVDDKGVERIKGTSEMDNDEFWRYVEKVRRFASLELKINIPDP